MADKTNQTTNQTEPAEQKRIVPRLIEHEMKASYLDYSMSVIVGRALPDVRDGLKPVHRRILYAMHQMGMLHNKPFKKSARIVGEVLGKFHPHGDLAVYDSLVRMAQPFSLRYPLIDGQGNFGSVDGDAPAAMRYCITGDSLVVTEKGLIPIKDIKDFSENENSENEKINLQILSKDKKVNKASKWFDSGEHPTLKVTTNKGYTIQGSYNHPLLTLTADASGKPIFVWKRLDEIKINDILVLDRSTELWPEELDLTPYRPRKRTYRTKIRLLPDKMTEDLALILGGLCSEGTVTKNKIEFCNTNEEFIRKFENAWKRTFPDSTLHKFKRNPSSYGKKPYLRLECHCLYTIDFLKNLGLEPTLSKLKRIPRAVMFSPRNVVAAFLRSYFEGDGSISFSKKMIELSCCSASEDLIKELQIILLRFGIDSFKRFDSYRQIHKLYIRGKRSILKFYKQIGFVTEIKNKKLEFVILNYKSDHSLFDYVPFVSGYVRKLVGPSEFIAKHNFDRYGNMKQNYQEVSAIVLRKAKASLHSFFEYLILQDYLFERVVRVEEAGVSRVYSIKVESDCHSFIANGFINHNTEARLNKLAEELLQDIDKETVAFVPNFDGSLKEPTVLPSKVPNLLVNGSSGIAVGMATNIPPHNMAEVCDAIIATINNPDITTEQLLELVRGPDFPTGGIILGRSGLKEAYESGRGKITVRARTIVEESKKRTRIIVTEIPYMVNKAQLVEEIAGLVRDKRVSGIADLRDESDREGMRIVLELKAGANPEVTLNQLFAHSRMQESFGIILLALVNNEPKVLSLKELIQAFIEHRKDIITKRTRYDLGVASDRAHILEGLMVALEHIDPIVALIKKSKTADEARKTLIADYKLSEKQAQAILDMTLKRLTGLEQEKIRAEHAELLKLIEELKSILASEQKILDIIKNELAELKSKYSDKRRTLLLEAEAAVIEEEELVKPESVVVTITHAGYVKRLPVDTYKMQRRGGKGIIAAEMKEEDFVEDLFVANTHDYILFFTNKGKVHWLKVYQIPEAGRYAKGTAIANLLVLEPGERITSFIPVREFKPEQYLFMVTEQGIVKKTPLDQFANPRKGGIIALTLNPSDQLIQVMLTDGSKQVFIATENGLAIRFNENEVRPMGRTAAGVIGIRLRNDKVIGAAVVDESKTILTVTEKGFGKRSQVADYRLTSRAGVGVRNVKVTEKNGKAVAIQPVSESDELMLITQRGVLIRTPVKDISVIGRATQGVRIMRLEEGDRVIGVARIAPEDYE